MIMIYFPQAMARDSNIWNFTTKARNIENTKYKPYIPFRVFTLSCFRDK